MRAMYSPHDHIAANAHGARCVLRPPSPFAKTIARMAGSYSASWRQSRSLLRPSPAFAFRESHRPHGGLRQSVVEGAREDPPWGATGVAQRWNVPMHRSDGRGQVTLLQGTSRFRATPVGARHAGDVLASRSHRSERTRCPLRPSPAFAFRENYRPHGGLLQCLLEAITEPAASLARLRLSRKPSPAWRDRKSVV